jgi:F-type H+-transporting ATPase subunit b
VAGVQTLLVLATEGGGEAGGAALLLPETAELVWGLVGFALLMVFMSKFAFPKLTALLDERAARIQGQLEEAEAAKADAQKTRQEYQSKLAEARSEASEIIEQARSDAERIHGEKVAEAEQEAEQIRARAQEDADGARSRVVADLRSQVAAASVELAGKIVQKELDPQQHRALVDQYIDELSGLN